jgi:hypothetical protein
MGIFRKIGNESESDTDLLTRPSLDENLQEDDGGHDRFAHYVKEREDRRIGSCNRKSGERSLCGKKWIPSRDPEKYPICPACKRDSRRVEDQNAEEKVIMKRIIAFVLSLATIATLTTLITTQTATAEEKNLRARL